VTGLEAISHYNGWVMAALGATIVFSGLAVLSLAVSLLPRIIRLIEGKQTPAEPPTAEIEPSTAEPEPAFKVPLSCPADIREVARLYEQIIHELGEPFQLAELYKLTQIHDLPHPHLTIYCLRQAEFLVSQGEGEFVLNKEKLSR